MKTKRDWELYHKFMIWTILQKRGNVDWGKESGITPTQEKKPHTSIIFSVDVAEPAPFGSFMERLETLEHRCKVFDTVFKSTVLASIKDGSARIRTIMKSLVKEDITDGLLSKLDNTIKTMEDALKQFEEKVKQENAERIIAALDVEEKVIEKVRVMNG